MKLKIAIVVHGRFHSFDLARALITRGHDVTVFTNYPGWATARFGLPKGNVRSFPSHGVLSRVAWRVAQKNVAAYPEARLHRMFGRWAARELSKESWDVVHLWSGVAEETLVGSSQTARLTLLMRGSAHIRTQARLLEEEAARTGVPLERPSAWMIAREEREYKLSDAIVTLSSFARDSFVAEGVDPGRVELLSLGAQLEAFRLRPEVADERRRRILRRDPLRVLYVGAVSFQKGMRDFAVVARALCNENFHFRCVGPMTPETVGLVRDLRGYVEFVPRQPQHELPSYYAGGDVFIFPTIQDGYAVVLAQAAAAGLPALATTNCAGPDIIRHGVTGWVLPIRSPAAFVEQLRWCDSNRAELAAMADCLYEKFRPRDWSQVAADFEALCTSGAAAAGHAEGVGLGH